MAPSFHVPRDRWLVMALFAALILLAVAASAGEAESSREGRRESRRSADAYILARGDHSFSMNASLEELERLKARQSAEFLWFRREGRAGFIRDVAILAEAARLFDGLEALEPEMSDLRRIERGLDERERALDREEDEFERLAGQDEGEGEDEENDPAGASAGNADLDRRRREVESRRGQLETEQRRLEAVERKLDARQDELERAAEQRLWRLIDRALRDGKAAPAKP